MQTSILGIWWGRTVTFALSALVAGSGVYWFLKGSGSAPLPAAQPVALASVALDPQAVARALGGAALAAPGAAPASASSRYVLAGVVADPSSKAGAALIAIDGKPAKPFRVGALVDGALVLQSVAPRRAVLAPREGGASALTLEMAKAGKPS